MDISPTNDKRPFFTSPPGESTEEDSWYGQGASANTNRQQWTLSMRPLATMQRSTALSYDNSSNYRNDGKTAFLQKLSELSLTRQDTACTAHKSMNHMATAPPAAPVHDRILFPMPTYPNQPPPKTPPVLNRRPPVMQPMHAATPEEMVNYQDTRIQSSQSIMMTGVPLLPVSPDLSMPANVRFPKPLFSPIAGGATEFRPCPELLVHEPSEYSMARHLPPPPSIPLSPELMVRPTRSLKMKPSEHLDVPFV